MAKNKNSPGSQTICFLLAFILAIRVLIAVSRSFTRSGIQPFPFKPALRLQPFHLNPTPRGFAIRMRIYSAGSPTDSAVSARGPRGILG